MIEIGSKNGSPPHLVFASPSDVLAVGGLLLGQPLEGQQLGELVHRAVDDVVHWSASGSFCHDHVMQKHFDDESGDENFKITWPKI